MSGSIVYLGDLSVSQIEERYRFEFTEEEREYLRGHHHNAAKFEDGDSGWHMFDLPPFLAISDGPIGMRVLEIFMSHSLEMNGQFPAGHPSCKGEGSA